MPEAKLYHELRGVDSSAENIRKSYKQLNEKIASFREILGEANANKFLFLQVPAIIDVASIQRGIIENYQDNIILKNTLEGRQTIEDTVLELDNDMKGIRRWLPRLKDKAYNARVEQLEELMPASYLKRRGFFAWDNFFTGFMAGGIICYGICLTFASCLLSEPTPENMEAFQLARDITTIYTPSIMWPIFGTILGSSMQLGRRSVSYKGNTIEAAKYIDGKVKELF